MVDEVHERTIQNDVLLGLLKKIIRKRQDLRIIISSASLDVNLYKHFFQDVEYSRSRDLLKPYSILTVQGRQYPVNILLLFSFFLLSLVMLLLLFRITFTLPLLWDWTSRLTNRR